MNIKVLIDRPKNKSSLEARGICSVYENNKEIIHEYFISGPWGKGHLPIGNYKIVYLAIAIQEPFKRCGFGWIASLEPQFKTDRTELAIHPDGGSYVGTLGCVGLQFMTTEFNKKFFEILKQGLKDSNSIPVEVIEGRI